VGEIALPYAQHSTLGVSTYRKHNHVHPLEKWLVSKAFHRVHFGHYHTSSTFMHIDKFLRGEFLVLEDEFLEKFLQIHRKFWFRRVPLAWELCCHPRVSSAASIPPYRSSRWHRHGREDAPGIPLVSTRDSQIGRGETRGDQGQKRSILPLDRQR
jgi:hypothetical protein